MSTTVKTGIDISPFHVEIPESALDDLRRRVGAARWPTRELVEGSDYAFVDAGSHELKGLRGVRSLYRLVGRAGGDASQP